MTRFSVQKVIFDLDGTLVDSAPDLFAATNHVLTSIGRDRVSLADVRHMVGFGARRLIELGLEATGGQDGEDIDALLPLFLDFYGDNIANETRLFEGGLEMLDTLRSSGFGVALCTNKPLSLTFKLLDTLGITDRFEIISGGDSYAFKKPDPRHILQTAALMRGAGPVLMVGDSATDINAARAAALPSVAVDFGYSTVPAHELGADVVIGALGDLPSLLTRA